MSQEMKPSTTLPSTLELLQRHSLTTLVQEEIERLILGGELSSGDKLNEALLAERLHVSRGPVREAFRALQASGLVRLVKNRGVFVRDVSVAEADEIYEVRAALEQLVGQRLATRTSTAQMKELRLILDHMQRSATRRDLDAYSSLNLQFHDTLVMFTGNGKLLATYRRLVNELNLYRRETLSSGSGEGGGLTVSHGEHRRIVDAISSGNEEAAGRAMHDHVIASRTRMHRAKDKRVAEAPDRKSDGARDRRRTAVLGGGL